MGVFRDSRASPKLERLIPMGCVFQSPNGREEPSSPAPGKVVSHGMTENGLESPEVRASQHRCRLPSHAST